jgi:hypothetical protein
MNGGDNGQDDAKRLVRSQPIQAIALGNAFLGCPAHVQHSDGGIATTWNNMSDPGAFAAAGAEEQEGGEPPPLAGAGVVVCLMGVRASVWEGRQVRHCVDGLRTNTVAGDLHRRLDHLSLWLTILRH